MNTEDKVEVRLLDKSFHVKCPADNRAQLQEAGRYLDRQMREVRDSGRVIGVERIAVMTALNLAFEVMQLKSQATTEGVSPEIVRRLEQMTDKITTSLSAEQLELDTTTV